MTRPLAALLGALLLVSACDTADPDIDPADLDAVATVASALSVETGGALDDVALALGGDAYADVRGPGHAGHGHAGGGGGACDVTSDYDPDTGGLTRTVVCAHGLGGGPFSHTSTRSLVVYFVDAEGAPLPSHEGAASATFTLLEGTSESTGPHGSRTVTETTGQGEVVGIDTDAMTLNASGSRSGEYAVTYPNGATRSATYTVTLDLADVTGPAPSPLGTAVFLRRWHLATSGTASGVYTADVTTTTAGGATATTSVERTFEITFPVAGEGRGRLRMDGREHGIDLGTGAVL